MVQTKLKKNLVIFGSALVSMILIFVVSLVVIFIIPVYRGFNFVSLWIPSYVFIECIFLILSIEAGISISFIGKIKSLYEGFKISFISAFVPIFLILGVTTLIYIFTLILGNVFVEYVFAQCILGLFLVSIGGMIGSYVYERKHK